MFLWLTYLRCFQTLLLLWDVALSRMAALPSSVTSHPKGFQLRSDMGQCWLRKGP